MVRPFRFLVDINCTLTRLSHLRVKFYLTQVSYCPNCNLSSFYSCRAHTYRRIIPSATEKHTEAGKNSRFAYGLSEMQGWQLSESYGYYPPSFSAMVAIHTLFFSLEEKTVP